MLPKTEKVDLRVRRTRRLVVRAFMELLEEKGLQATTVSDIAERAMINRATFYAHFADKYDLFAAIIRESFQEAIRSKLPEPAALNLDNLRRLVTAVFEYLDTLTCQASTPTDRQFRPMVETQVQEELYRWILDWIAPLGQSREQPSAEVVASLLSWAIFGAGLRLSQRELDLAAGDVIDELLQMMAGGVPFLSADGEGVGASSN